MLKSTKFYLKYLGFGILIISFILILINTNSILKASQNNIINPKQENIINPKQENIINPKLENIKDDKQNNSSDTSDKSNIEDKIRANLANKSPEFKYQIILGDPNSKIVVEEFSSLGCHGCKLYHEDWFPGIKENFIDTKKIKYVVTEFIQGAQDYQASILLKYIIKKYGNTPIGQQKYLELRTYLFDNQEKWLLSKDFKNILADIGIKFGISKEEFFQALEDEALSEELLIKHIQKMMIKSIAITPAVTINDELCYKDEEIEDFILNEIDNLSIKNNQNKKANEENNTHSTIQTVAQKI